MACQWSGDIMPVNILKVQHYSTLLYRTAKQAQQQWAEYRGHRKPELLSSYYLAMKELCTDIFMIARAVEMDTTDYRVLPSIFEKSSAELLSAVQEHNAVAPATLGRVTFAMKDIFLVSQDLLEDARSLGNEEVSEDFLVFGSDFGVVLTSLVPIAKTLKLPIQPFVRARNQALTYFRLMSDNLLEALPVGAPGGVEEVPVESIVLACRVKRAAAMLRSNPRKACILLEKLVKVLR